MDSNSDKIYDVIILGAGISGLGSAYKLLENNNTSFIILEKSEGVGGTWRENTYPGLCCDVPSHFYSFSFAMNPDWTKTYPEQYEILDYLENITDKLEIRPYIRFNSEVLESKFNENESLWETFLKSGEKYKSRSLISGLGQLNKPNGQIFMELKHLLDTAFIAHNGIIAIILLVKKLLLLETDQAQLVLYLK